MRALSILAICCLLPGFSATAQLHYTFKAGTMAYTPLNGATSVTGGKTWTGYTSYTLPLGFNFKIDGVTTQTMILSGTQLHRPIVAKKLSGFLPTSTGLVDRGALSGTSRSDIRYTTTGTLGSRIFKVEFANAGFEDEMDQFGELKDSTNLQIWLYEGSNAVEYHFGKSGLRHFDEYFGGRFLSGYVKNFDTAANNWEKIYYLTGTANAPTLDSTTTAPSTGIATYPVSGQVYRFAPKGSTTAVELPAPRSLATVFPTRCQNNVQIRNTAGVPLQTTIYNTEGRVAMQLEIRSGDCQLDLSRMPAGVYIVRLTDPANGLSESQRIEKL